jgi:transcriptional regulator with XRE-family HTH domain
VTDQGFAKRLNGLVSDSGLTKTEFARRVFVTHPTVSKWARGVVPRRAAADAICRNFGVSRMWLLRGEGPKRAEASGSEDTFRKLLNLSIELPDERAADLSQQAFAEYLNEAGEVSEYFSDLIEQYESLARHGDIVISSAREKIRQLNAAHHRRINEIALEKARLTKESEKRALHSSDIPESSSKVIPLTLSALRERVLRATTEKGAKKQLAAALNVSPQQLSDWLRGSYEPGGNVTLRMLAWVEAKEGKTKKHPEDARTPSGLKTRLRKSTSHEKPKSDQKKSSHKERKSTTGKGSPS